MNDYSYINASIEAISGYKTRDGLISTFASRISDEVKSPTIINAIAVAHDRTVVADTNHRFNDGEAPICSPIAFLDYVQTVMNKVCGLARRDLLGKRTADYGNGIDFSQEITDQVGFSVHPEKIADLVDEDFRVLNNLHAYIAQGMPYLTDISPLYYHAENVKLEDESWVKDNIANDFNDALTVFEKKAEEYRENVTQLRQGESNSIDFSAKSEAKPKAKAKTKAKKKAA